MKKVFLSLAFMLVAGVGTISAHPLTVTFSNGMKTTLESSDYESPEAMALHVLELEKKYSCIDMKTANAIINKDISGTPDFW